MIGTLKIFQPSEAAAAAAANGVVYVWGQKSFIGSYAWMLASLQAVWQAGIPTKVSVDYDVPAYGPAEEAERLKEATYIVFFSSN